MPTINSPFNYPYTTFDEVFHTENGQITGWAREKVAVTGTKSGIYQIGTLVILGDDRETAKIPASIDDLIGAKTGAIAILARKDLPQNLFQTGASPLDINLNFNPDVLHLTDDALTKEHVVIADARNGGSIGDAQIVFPEGTTKEQKKAVFIKLKSENGFKVLRQAVRG